MISRDKESVAGIGVMLGFGVLLLGWHVLRSSWEAEAYTRLTGKSVTTWDAIFLDLRVQEPIKE